MEHDLNNLRGLLKADSWKYLRGIKTDQQQRIAQPPVQKDPPPDAELIDLPAPDSLSLGGIPLIDAINARASVRRYSDASLSLDELSFLLWATQGVKELSTQGTTTMRVVPSGGARHAFETYLLVNRVDGLSEGLYRFLAVEHSLAKLAGIDNLPARIVDACMGQGWCGRSAVVFVWACIPYRMEWRYSFTAHKTIALDAGHVCQNLYLAVTAIGCGTCAVGAYDQQRMDELIGVDGDDEFTVYLAPVGKV